MLAYQNGVVLDFDDYYVQDEWFGADNSLCFSLPDDHPQLPDMMAQLPLTDKESEQRYLITSIDEGDVKAVLDLDELKGTIYVNYNSGSHAPADIISTILPLGWSVIDDAHIETRRTLELPGATPLDIIRECVDTFGITAAFDNARRVVCLRCPENEPATGAYFTEELNLKKLPIHRSTTSEFATRLYAVGKDGLTFSSINDGKNYIDNNEYSDRVVCAFWKDERYTDAESLLEDAQAKLASMARPAESYQCDVVDLAKIDPEKWGHLTVFMYQGVILMDKKRNSRMMHRVSRYKRYPHHPEKNVVTLSSVPGTLTSKVQQSYDAVTNPNSAFQQQYQISIDSITSWLTDEEGVFAFVRGIDGRMQRVTGTLRIGPAEEGHLDLDQQSINLFVEAAPNSKPAAYLQVKDGKTVLGCHEIYAETIHYKTLIEDKEGDANA